MAAAIPCNGDGGCGCEGSRGAVVIPGVVVIWRTAADKERSDDVCDGGEGVVVCGGASLSLLR
ncbi:hypothetical protein A2U01_0109330, partial [Trifolium medium]|nr:hypothetical protein [Trifolium medium]